MALTMSNATYARSTTGMNALKNDLQNDIQKIANNLRPSASAFNTLKSTIKANWVGEDCDAYLAHLERKLNSMSNDIIAYKKVIETALTGDLNDFKRFQSSNVSNMNNI
ncbi:MAG: hypothetical protein HFJ02_03000 [Bacilli bacterium]|jgi:hypothetical protein|nr:hypothetical protein [Bacilli bacterium]